MVPSTPSHLDEQSSQPKVVPRVLKAPRLRKSKAGRSDKAKTPKLTAPLSILTRSLHHILVKNMEEWVNRPADVRRREAEKRNGYITRPMNSFMLYRSAYAERAKSWCLQNNHQVVSSVAGESWPMEPTEVRELYNEYAKIERINHQNAHPTYKFSPSKTAAPPRKRRHEWSDDEPSDLEDIEWAPGSGRSRARQARKFERSLSYPTHGAETIYFDRPFASDAHNLNRPSWEMTNEGRPMMLPMAHNDLYNQYYQTAAYPEAHMHADYHDDMHLRRVDTPALLMQFPSDQSLLGLPGGSAADLMPQLHPHSSENFGDEQLDPVLLVYGNDHSDINPAALHQGYRHGHMGMSDGRLHQNELDSLLEFGHAHHDYRSGSWQSDPAMVSLEEESEFDKWMGEH